MGEVRSQVWSKEGEGEGGDCGQRKEEEERGCCGQRREEGGGGGCLL